MPKEFIFGENGGIPTEREISPEEEALYKVIAETSCLVYHLTKIPLVQGVLQSFEDKPIVPLAKMPSEILIGRIRLNGAEYLCGATIGAHHCDFSEWVEACRLRNELFCASLTDRVRVEGSLERAWQTEEQIWQKVRDEEVGELAEEAGKLRELLVAQNQPAIFPELEAKVAGVSLLAGSQEKDIKKWLGTVLATSRYLGVESELNLFQFMAEKQRGRITSRKENLTQKDKEEEWKRLLPLARRYFQ